MELVGKVSLVTGAGRGIGREIALTLARHGSAVSVVDLDLAAAKAVRDEIAAQSGKATAVRADVSNGSNVEAMFSATESGLGPVDILVNNAGIGFKAIAAEMSEADWRRVLDVNLTGTFLCSQAALRKMIPRGFGRIINVSSTAALRISYAAGAAYTASKAGILALTRHLAYEAAPYGVTVNAVCPGTTETGMIAHESGEEKRRRLAGFPIGRFVTVEDHANAVLFLALPASSAISGQTLAVDGGALLGWLDHRDYVKVMASR